MTKWIEVRDQLPPVMMQVLVYVKDRLDGYTEDYVTQAHLYEKDDDNLNHIWSVKGVHLTKYEEVTHWTLLPIFPVPWKT